MKQNQCRWSASTWKRGEGLPLSSKSSQEDLLLAAAVSRCTSLKGPRALGFPPKISIPQDQSLPRHRGSSMAHSVMPAAVDALAAKGANAMAVAEVPCDQDSTSNHRCNLISPKEACGMTSPGGLCATCGRSSGPRPVFRLLHLLRQWCALFNVEQRQQACQKTAVHGTVFHR